MSTVDPSMRDASLEAALEETRDSNDRLRAQLEALGMPFDPLLELRLRFDVLLESQVGPMPEIGRVLYENNFEGTLQRVLQGNVDYLEQQELEKQGKKANSAGVKAPAE